ncbi:MAG: tetraacyldisaccharide 4'-kinase [Flavobacterium sp.]|nr:MAG: tetraacyldisaccharide 4'-kinase [Flavobacterium sp.]
MELMRKLTFPFAVIYGIVTAIRNYFFDKGILKSTSFDIPVIAVGNLSVGGTGKSPQIEYLIRLLSPKYNVATLSRGYKRSTKGFVLADENASAETLGDEPFQFYSKFPNIGVAVDADRTNGIKNLLQQTPKPEVILLDDAFQHRKVKAGFYILLTAYNDLYADDFILPAGNLRESRSGAHRANIVVVTKCPRELSDADQSHVRLKLKLEKHQQLYFSFIDYDENVYADGQSLPVESVKNEPKIVLAGIAKPKPFFEYLHHESDMILEFPDHHSFTDTEISGVKAKAKDKKIITTEKDYVRLKTHSLDNLFYLPIKSSFLADSENFDKTILDYVGKSTANS